MSDFTIRPITHFDHFIIHRISKNNEIIGGSEGMDFGPFGLTNQRIITEDQARNIAWYFTRLSSMNPARLLLLDAKYHNIMEDFNRAILDIGIALEIHVEWRLNQYSYIERGLSELISDNNSICDYYKDILAKATVRSLLENEDLFMNLEYLRYLRNSVVYEWKPICKDSEISKSNFMSKHKERNYSIINSKERVEILINMANEILSFTQNLFKQKFEM